jgi:hypothetical protein
MAVNIDNVKRTVVLALKYRAETYTNRAWTDWNLRVAELIETGEVTICDGERKDNHG